MAAEQSSSSTNKPEKVDETSHSTTTNPPTAKDVELIVATKAGRLQEILDCLDNGANVNVVDREGNSPLHIACALGFEFSSHILIDRGAAINGSNLKGRTPLHLACLRNSDSLARFLLSKGAGSNCKDIEEETPLHISSRENNEKIARLLLHHEAAIDAQNLLKQTPLHCASANGHDLIVELLVEHGACITLRDGRGNTPLHEAICGGHETIAQYLLEQGADIKEKNEDGRTPCDMVEEEGLPSFVALVREWATNPPKMKQREPFLTLDLAKQRISVLEAENEQLRSERKILGATLRKIQRTLDELALNILSETDE